MKLIDLLVKELPKRGGWPQNVTHIRQDYDRELMFYGRGRAMTGIFLDELAIDHRKCGRAGAKITSDQYQSALAASQKVEWSGDGLPPVGTECEYCDKNTSEWMVVNVTYLSSDVIVISRNYPECSVEMAIDLITDSKKARFRPLQSEADGKREVAIEAMQREADEGDNWIYSEYEIIYDAIAAGKIPGVKLDD